MKMMNLHQEWVEAGMEADGEATEPGFPLQGCVLPERKIIFSFSLSFYAQVVKVEYVLSAQNNHSTDHSHLTLNASW